MSLSAAEINRYLRQINLKEIGLEGQIKLKNAKVLCVGAGGLGSPLLLYLAAAGVGTLGIMDHDDIDISNLPRQILYQDEHINYKKTEILKAQLHKINPHINIDIYHQRFTAESKEIISQYDIVSDCTDNFTSRYVINDLCFSVGIPYVFASVEGFEGQCSTFLGNQGPCYRCLFPDIASDAPIPNCNMAGVLGVLPGILGLIQATEIIKWIINTGNFLYGRVLTVDLLKMQFREFRLKKNPECKICKTENHPKNTVKNLDVTPSQYLISPDKLQELLRKKENIQLIDVRTSIEHYHYNIGGKLIPLEELPNRLSELSPDQLIITYCNIGCKSLLALELLLNAGFISVRSLDGGINAWH